MRVEVEVTIRAPGARVWQLVTDIPNSVRTISGIQKVEVLERPPTGILGLKWRETRTLFGKTATEVMWITGVEEGSSYETEARSHGSVYRSEIRVSEVGDRTRLRMVFEAEALTFGARVFSVLLAFMIKGATKKALLQDLMDVKAVAEGGETQGSTS